MRLTQKMVLLLVAVIAFAVPNTTFATLWTASYTTTLSNIPSAFSSSKYSAGFAYNSVSNTLYMSYLVLAGINGGIYLTPGPMHGTNYEGFYDVQAIGYDIYGAPKLSFTPSNHEFSYSDTPTFTLLTPPGTTTAYQLSTTAEGQIGHIPAPPAWLMMLTGLGLLASLYRRHRKRQRS